MLSMACGFSNLEMRGVSEPNPTTICRTIFTSAAVADEREGNRIHAVLQTEFQVFAVFFG